MNAHLDLLTPLERLSHRLLGWQYARIWVGADSERGGWYYLTVRVQDVDGVPCVPIQRTAYEDCSTPDFAMSASITQPARLSDFKHMWLTPRIN